MTARPPHAMIKAKQETRKKAKILMLDDALLQKMREQLVNYVNRITVPDKRAGQNKYRCPLCGSGNQNGNTHDGAFSITKDGLHWHCFSCNQSGDIFTLVGLHEGLTDFKAQKRRIAELYGYDDTERGKMQEHTKKASTGKYKEYIEHCKEAAGETSYFKDRGFNDEIVRQYGLGYDSKRDVIVIPYDVEGSYYITRSTSGKNFRKPKSDEAGAEPVYNKEVLYADKPCFVCESPIDAISIMAASGNIAQAVALGGTGTDKLVSQIKEKKPTAPLILSFDNDDAGMKATKEAAKKLIENGISFVTATYSLENYPETQRKDANDLFITNSQQLRADIEANVGEIERLANAELAEKLVRHNAITGAERLKDFIGGIHGNANTAYTPTGFNKLDNELDGGFYPGLYILGAISSLGKTTFLLQLADQIAMQGKDVLYFSLEMSANELISKSISRQTYLLCRGNRSNAKTARGITTASRYERYSAAEKSLISAATASYSKYANHMYYYEGVGDIGAEQIREALREHVELTGNTPLIFVDYLQILAPYDVRASDKQNTDKAVLELKRLSRDYKTSVVCISSFNRESYANGVSMKSFKESGAIEYGSDVLLGLQPQGMKPGYDKTEQKENIKTIDACKKSEDRDVEMKVLKNRNGKTNGTIGFIFHSLFNSFEQDESYTTDSGFIPYSI